MNLTADDMQRMSRVLRHRLRNVASGIKTSISLIAGELGDSVAPGVREYFPLIANECQMLADMTDRLGLLFDGVPDPGAPVTLANLFDILDDRIRETMPRCRVLFKKPVASLRVEGATRLIPALIEILQNACDAGGSKAIVVQTHVDNGRASITIHDKGGGIVESELRKIPAVFYTTRSKHVGIGLSIARRLIHASGGTMTLRNESGGLCVTLEVPVLPAVPAEDGKTL